jgi:hypothetical protein
MKEPAACAAFLRSAGTEAMRARRNKEKKEETFGCIF